MNALLQKAEVAYGWFLNAINGLQSPFLLLIRVYWGWLFLQSGIGKFGHIDKVVLLYRSRHSRTHVERLLQCFFGNCRGHSFDPRTRVAIDLGSFADQYDRGLYHR
jgi:hypothetical protein